ncbi:MAG: NHLP bacteriocin export ABC transporter permease/ATPase subunit [Eubacteriales bacterium]|nr:NHLP bacteriocin export ABC transporter permease/ATPase subunit [Eubacteriales bacterium]MDY5933470.1 NHLP bacteriocin export ABC transporter permease/ATPase subunit [Eubacteriales bacterium]
MGWFEEQIKLRSEKDGEALDEALKNVSAMIEGKKRRSFSDDREKIKSALDEILAYYGVRPRDIPHDVKEVDDQIEYSCRQSGIMYRSVKLEKGWYRDAAGAMLGRLKSGEVVALLPDKLGRYGFFNPNTQKRVKLNRKTQELFEEDAYCFYKPFPLKKIGIRDLIKYIFSTIDVSVIVYIVAITLFATLVGMITPKITKILFSDVLESKSLQLLLSVACFYVCTSLSLLLIRGIKSLLMNRVSIQMDVSVQAATMARVLSLPPNFFKNYSSGEITSRAQSVNSLCTTLVQTFLSTGLTSLFSLLYITQVFVYAKELVVPALCVTIATLVFSVVSSLVQMKISEKQMELSGKMSGLTYQIITGVQKIKLSGSEKRVFARWLNHYSEEAKLTYNPPKFLLFNGVISTAISLVGTIVMYFFAVQSNVSVADYTAFNSAYGMLSGALMSVAGIALTAARIKPVFEMAKPIMNAEPEISEGKQTVTKISGGIELSHVSFRYDVNSPLVVDDLSLKIRPGQYVAVVGKTGCGKSTLLRLLLGFEKPQKGAIYYDGRDIETVDLRSLRKKIGVVTQNGKLFQGDIYSNIVISAPYLSVDDAWKAAEVADIAEDIRKMPMGMHTIISEGAGGISGGQKQRLMIARAVAPNPKILMFDEATSALDNITQKKVSEALDGLKCTRIVIAHRLSTIKQCDRIIVLDGGKIAEDGTYDELLAKKGYFYELVERQRLDK